MTTARPSMDSLPNETLLHIISMCENFRPSAFHPNPVLHRLSLVCKSLHAVANHELYNRVYLSPSTRNDFECLYFKATRFLHTVQNNPYLASIVRELHFASPWCNAVETEALSEAITCCGGVEELDLSGWGWSDEWLLKQGRDSLRGLKEAMRAKTGLKKLRLSHRAVNGHFCSLAGMEEFLNMLQSWPNIESVVIEDGLIGEAELWRVTWAAEDEEQEVVTERAFAEEVAGGSGWFDGSGWFGGRKSRPVLFITTNACPRLAQLTFRCHHLRDVHVIALSKIAPNIESLFVLAGQDYCAFTASSVRSAFGRWSYSLTELRVVYELDHDRLSSVSRSTKGSEESMSEVLPPEMGALRLARTTSIHIPPADFRNGYLALEKLTYGLWYDEVPVFLQVLRSEGSLPNLRQLNVIVADYGEHVREVGVSVGALEELCLSKGIEYHFDEDDEEDTGEGNDFYGVRMHNWEEDDDPYERYEL